jgi:hypothetical protein
MLAIAAWIAAQQGGLPHLSSLVFSAGYGLLFDPAITKLSCAASEPVQHHGRKPGFVEKSPGIMLSD